jgi:hypothetical protein
VRSAARPRQTPAVQGRRQGTLTLNAPWAVWRTRGALVAERRRLGRHGDDEGEAGPASHRGDVRRGPQSGEQQGDQQPMPGGQDGGRAGGGGGWLARAGAARSTVVSS